MTHHYQSYLQSPALLEQWTEEELMAKIASYPLDTGYKILLALKKGGSSVHDLAIHCWDSFLRREAFGQFVKSQVPSPADVIQPAVSQPAVLYVSPQPVDMIQVNSETPVTTATEEHVGQEVMEDSQTVVLRQDLLEEQTTPEWKPNKQKKKKHKFQMREYSGISPFSVWLLSFQEDDVEKKMRKEAKAAKRRALEESARKSVTSTPEVISEPLADILASQGHLDAAKKMYTQLMMKYPEKSSYFAAKIENLLKNIEL